MKKTILLIAASLLITTKIYTQFSLGASGGINWTKGKLELELELVEVSSIVYYYFGVIPKYRFNSRFSISSDIQYSLKGFMTDNDLNVNTKLNYVYLDFLPKVEYQITKNIEIGLGFNVGLKFDEQQKVNEASWISTKEIETVASSDFGIVGSIRASVQNFFVVVSYNYGLKDIFKSHLYNANGQYVQVFEGNQYN